MKYLNLTNANPAHRGNSLAVRADLIVTVHTATVTREDLTAELVTYIFCPPHGSWEVLETYEDIVNELNQE
jgi:hypothetical protein